MSATVGGVTLGSTNGRRLPRGRLGPVPSPTAAYAPIVADVGELDAADELELALVAACGGDEAGFATLWRELHPRLLRYLRSRGDDAADDLAAETWMHVVRGLPTFQGEFADFRAWLFTIARHRAVDQGRARTRGLTLVSVADPAGSGGRLPSAPSAEQEVAENDATAAALRLVATLPPTQAEMVILRVVAGLDVAEVARLMGKRPGAVRVGVHRGLKTLAQTTGPDPEGGES